MLLFWKEFILAQAEIRPLPSAPVRQSLIPWSMLPNKSVFVYLGTLDHVRKFNDVIYGGDFESHSTSSPSIRAGGQGESCEQLTVSVWRDLMKTQYQISSEIPWLANTLCLLLQITAKRSEPCPQLHWDRNLEGPHLECSPFCATTHLFPWLILIYILALEWTVTMSLRAFSEFCESF